MNQLQLNQLRSITDQMEIYLEDTHLLAKYMKDYETKDWDIKDGEGGEHDVYFSDDGNYVVKLAKEMPQEMYDPYGLGILEVKEQRYDLGERRFERFKKEIILPDTPLITKSVAVSPYYSVEKNVGVDLSDKMKTEPLPSLSSRLKICRDIFLGLSKIHLIDLVHLDIKPDNIFIDKDLNISIGDFGFLDVKDTKNLHGTIAYSTPFVSKRKGIEIDIYAAALVSIEVIRWKRDTFCFDDLKMAIFRARNKSKLCSSLSTFFSRDCLRDFKNLDNSIPGIVESLRCAIVGEECDSTCNSTAFSIYELWSEMYEKVEKEDIREPEPLPPLVVEKWWKKHFKKKGTK